MSKNTDLGSLVNYIKGQVTGQLNAPAYTSATAFTGTIAGYLGFDTSGNILTTGVGISGTTNYISKFTGSTSLGNSLIYDNGTYVGIGTISPSTFLHIVGANTLNRGQLSIQSNNVSNAARVTWFYDTSQQGEIGTNGADFYALATNNFLFFASGAERMRITSAGELNINTTTTGYTLNAISSTFTQFNTSFKGSGSLINIMSRFMQDTSTNRGIAIGYAYDSELVSGIWATQDTGTLMLGVRVGSNYKSKININTTTVALDIPSSSAGLGSGQLWNDGGTVKIV